MVTTDELKTKIKNGFSMVKGEYIADMLFMMRETTIICQEQYSELMNYISELEDIKFDEEVKETLKAEKYFSEHYDTTIDSSTGYEVKLDN